MSRKKFKPEVRYVRRGSRTVPMAVMLFDADECEAVGHYFPSHDVGGDEFLDAAEWLRKLMEGEDDAEESPAADG